MSTEKSWQHRRIDVFIENLDELLGQLKDELEGSVDDDEPAEKAAEAGPYRGNRLPDWSAPPQGKIAVPPSLSVQDEATKVRK